MKVLFVCHGNVNRSPAAQIIAEQQYPFLDVKSCGLKAKEGTITAKKMRDTLNEFGYYTNGIRSIQMTMDYWRWADIIFYMDSGNERRLNKAFGLSKSKRLSDYCDINKIPDPAFSKGREAHKLVIYLIDKALFNWVKIERIH